MEERLVLHAGAACAPFHKKLLTLQTQANAAEYGDYYYQSHKRIRHENYFINTVITIIYRTTEYDTNIISFDIIEYGSYKRVLCVLLNPTIGRLEEIVQICPRSPLNLR